MRKRLMMMVAVLAVILVAAAAAIAASSPSTPSPVGEGIGGMPILCKLPPSVTVPSSDTLDQVKELCAADGAP
jgi:hypothetical protein